MMAVYRNGKIVADKIPCAHPRHLQDHITRLANLVEALRDVKLWYEQEFERSTFEDDEMPEELVRLEKRVQELS